MFCMFIYKNLNKCIYYGTYNYSDHDVIGKLSFPHLISNIFNLIYGHRGHLITHIGDEQKKTCIAVVPVPVNLMIAVMYLKNCKILILNMFAFLS